MSGGISNFLDDGPSSGGGAGSGSGHRAQRRDRENDNNNNNQNNNNNNANNNSTGKSLADNFFQTHEQNQGKVYHSSDFAVKDSDNNNNAKSATAAAASSSNTNNNSDKNNNNNNSSSSSNNTKSLAKKLSDDETAEWNRYLKMKNQPPETLDAQGLFLDKNGIHFQLFQDELLGNKACNMLDFLDNVPYETLREAYDRIEKKIEKVQHRLNHDPRQGACSGAGSSPEANKDKLRNADIERIKFQQHFMTLHRHLAPAASFFNNRLKQLQKPTQTLKNLWDFSRDALIEGMGSYTGQGCMNLIPIWSFMWSTSNKNGNDRDGDPEPPSLSDLYDPANADKIYGSYFSPFINHYSMHRDWFQPQNGVAYIINLNAVLENRKWIRIPSVVGVPLFDKKNSLVFTKEAQAWLDRRRKQLAGEIPFEEEKKKANNNNNNETNSSSSSSQNQNQNQKAQTFANDLYK